MLKLLIALLICTCNAILNANAFSSKDIELQIAHAKFLVKQGDYQKGIEQYTQLIELMEPTSDPQIFQLYNERGDLYFAIQDYSSALKDFQKIPIKTNHTSWEETSEILRAICGRMFSSEYLNQDKEAEREFDDLVHAVTPIRNDLDNIPWLKGNPILIAHKKLKSSKKEPCKDCEKYMQLNSGAQENCQMQCSGYAVGASWACSRVPNPAIQFLCVGCIWGLERACNWCCKGDGFWENCVKPLRRLLHDPEHPENPAPHPFE